jgi:hypothetical protein
MVGQCKELPAAVFGDDGPTFTGATQAAKLKIVSSTATVRQAIGRCDRLASRQSIRETDSAQSHAAGAGQY